MMISQFISWQEYKEGRKNDLPKNKESHKDILFTDWDIQLKQVEKAVARVDSTTNNIINVVIENLHSDNLIKECKLKILPNFKQLEKHWKETAKTKEKVIKKLSKLE